MAIEKDVSIGGWLFTSMYDTLQNGFISLFTSLAENYAGVAGIITTLYVVLVGYKALQGNYGEATKDVLMSVILVPIVYALAFNVDNFLTWIYEPIMGTTFGMMGLFFGSKGASITDIYQPIENTFSNLFSTIDVMTTKTSNWGLGDLKLTIVGFMLSVLYGALYVLFSVLLIMSMFSLHVMLVLAPIQVFFGAFKPTRGFFTAWLKAVVTYALIPVFTVLVMSYTLDFLNEAIQDIASLDIEKDGVFNGAVASAFFIGLMSFSLHWKAPEFASALTGAQVSGVGAFFGAAAAVGGAGVAAYKGLGGDKLNGKMGGALAAGGKGVLETGLYQGSKNAYSQMRGFGQDAIDLAKMAKQKMGR